VTEAPKALMVRVAPPHEFEDDLVKLTSSQPGRDYPLFSSKQKAMMFAASLGRYRGRRQEEPFRRGTAIRLEVFQQAFDDRFLDAIAIVTESGLGVLAPERAAERGRIFEEYAYFGLREMIDRCLKSTGDPLQVLLALTDDVRAQAAAGFENIDPTVLRSLMGGRRG
jgi:dnd system-associated protein 4